MTHKFLEGSNVNQNYLDKLNQSFADVFLNNETKTQKQVVELDANDDPVIEKQSK